MENQAGIPHACNTHLEYGVHDAGQRAVVRVPGHVEDVEAPLVQIFQLLLESTKREGFEGFVQAISPKFTNMQI